MKGDERWRIVPTVHRLPLLLKYSVCAVFVCLSECVWFFSSLYFCLSPNDCWDRSQHILLWQWLQIGESQQKRDQYVAPSMLSLLWMSLQPTCCSCALVSEWSIPVPVSTNTCWWWLPYFVYTTKQILARIWTNQTVPHAHNMTTGGLNPAIRKYQDTKYFSKPCIMKNQSGTHDQSQKDYLAGIFCKYLKQPKRALTALLGLRHFVFYFLRHSLINIFQQLSIIFFGYYVFRREGNVYFMLKINYHSLNGVNWIPH